MMSLLSHILLRSARAYPRSAQLEPVSWRYDEQVGAWVGHDTRKLMVLDATTQPYGTKKNDIETGEDAKGQ